MSETKKRLLAEDLTAYERWELPAFAGGAERRAGPAKAKPNKADKLPTAGELEKIRKDAYDEGLAEGRRDGHKAGREEGYKQGMAQGREEGLALGKAEGQQQIEQALASMSKLMTELADPISIQEQQLVQAMANVSIAIARSVIHRELHTDSSVITELAGRLLSTLPATDTGITLSVSPGDLDHVQQAVQMAKLEVKLESNPRIHPGGCTVSSSTQLIDYTVEKRFQKTVQEMLLQATQQSDVALAQESPSEIQEQSDYAPEVLDEVSAGIHSEPPGADQNEEQNEDSSSVPEAGSSSNPGEGDSEQDPNLPGDDQQDPPDQTE